MRIIAIANQKGGVGKTTTAVSLSHDLARRGYTTVLVDLDPQGNAATCLGVAPAPGLHQLMLGLAGLETLLVEARPNLWLLPGDVTTAEVVDYVASKPYREGLLARALAPLEADFCILDAAPSRFNLHTLMLHAADGVIIPSAVDHLAIVGVTQELDTLQLVSAHGHEAAVLAILPTFWDAITKESATNLAKLVEAFGALVLPAVPRVTKLREASAYGQTIWEWLSDDHAASAAYRHLTERVLEEKHE